MQEWMGLQATLKRHTDLHEAAVAVKIKSAKTRQGSWTLRPKTTGLEVDTQSLAVLRIALAAIAIIAEGGHQLEGNRPSNTTQGAKELTVRMRLEEFFNCLQLFKS